ncbi:MAG: squalene/phytoene synthase family protein [Alphaproteobacteria bacterium]|nr:squalene/phytoene synthase family protein [Alphaproteobacteria bacterium]
MDDLIKKLFKNSEEMLSGCLYMMSAKKRHAVYGICAFAEIIDDILNSKQITSQKIELLDAWQKEIENVYNNAKPRSLAVRALFKNFSGLNLVKEDFLVFIDNGRQELLNPPQVLSTNNYNKSCDNKSGAFIRQLLRVLGCRDEEKITKLSDCLGKALQTTVYLRDVKEDAADGKIYMPKDCLQKAGISSTKPLEIIVDNNLGLARSELGKLASSNYAEAFAEINSFDKKTSQRLRAFFYPYKYCFDVMEKRGWEVITPKPKLSVFAKIWLLIKAYTEK